MSSEEEPAEEESVGTAAESVSAASAGMSLGGGADLISSSVGFEEEEDEDW